MTDNAEGESKTIWLGCNALGLAEISEDTCEPVNEESADGSMRLNKFSVGLLACQTTNASDGTTDNKSPVKAVRLAALIEPN